MNAVNSAGRTRAPISRLAFSLVAIAVAIALFAGNKPVAAQESKDNLIVPGVRIGPARLGMTETDLYKLLGDPTSSRSAPGNNQYSYPMLTITCFTATHKVFEIDTVDNDQRYATAEGIKVGSSGLAVRAQLGKFRERSTSGITYYDYAHGMTVTIGRDGNVSGLGIWVPGQFHF